MNKESQLVIYQADDGSIKIDVRLEDETVWLTQANMAELFQVKPQNVTMHLKNIYIEGELQEKATCKEFLQVQKEGKRQVERKRKFYNLDVIISIGYRIQSQIATQFRIWATNTLKQHLVKGYTLNQNRIESFGVDVEQLVDLVQKTLSNHGLAKPEGFAYNKVDW